MQNNQQQIQQYLDRKVNPIFEQIMIDIAKAKPKNVINFCKAWFDKKAEQTQKQFTIESSQSEEQSEDEQSLQCDRIIAKKKAKQRWYDRRVGICGQVYCEESKANKSKVISIPKSPSVYSRIIFRLKSIFLFKNFDDDDTSKIICAVKEQTYEKDQIVIEQGEPGNSIFIIDSGDFYCYRTTKQGKEIYLKTLTEGDMFGELSMLYNTKRTANIRVKNKATCFTLDRKAFNTVIRQKNLKRRKTVMNIMNKVEFFREFEKQQLFHIQDIIKEMPVHINQYIIKEGKINNRLFFIEHGKLVTMQKQSNGHDKVIHQLKDDDFFGLSSFIDRKPCKISVMALTTSKLYYLDFKDMERVVGPISKILQRDITFYEKHMMSWST